MLWLYEYKNGVPTGNMTGHNSREEAEREQAEWRKMPLRNSDWSGYDWHIQETRAARMEIGPRRNIWSHGLDAEGHYVLSWDRYIGVNHYTFHWFGTATEARGVVQVLVNGKVQRSLYTDSGKLFGLKALLSD